MPDGLPLVDQLAYEAMAHLYARYRAKQISRAQGTAEKGRILYELERNRRQLNVDTSLAKSAAEMFVRVEFAASRYAKQRTLEHADELYAAIYRMRPEVAG